MLHVIRRVLENLLKPGLQDALVIVVGLDQTIPVHVRVKDPLHEDLRRLEAWPGVSGRGGG